jgi:beta-glucosidase
MINDCFPQDFLWGAATSAYQIEGSPLADGAGPSNWHRFAHTPGCTHRGQTGDMACDHYRRWSADIALMQELGLQAYRFSLAWSRLMPEGRGQVNQAGLDFYSRLTDRLLACGIQPCITLHHWDLPVALADRGGWLERDIVGWFADYAQVVFRTLGDRVPLFTTLNEPWVIMDAGYLHGVHPPGLQDPAALPRVAHNLLRAHGAAVQAYRAEASQQIGVVVNLEPKDPATDTAEDVAAAQRADAYMNRFFLDPLFRGHYPAELPEMFGQAWPSFPAADLALIQEPIDFLAINYYTRSVVQDDARAPLPHVSKVKQSGSIYTETGWEVHPQSLTNLLLRVCQDYGERPLYITENGAAFADPDTVGNGAAEAGEGTAAPGQGEISVDGDILEDPLRVDYYRGHLLAVLAALKQGVDLRGYFAWSLLDNFEWAQGYSKRFGLVHVNFATQQRTFKRSAHFYREVIRTRGEVLNQLAEDAG